MCATARAAMERKYARAADALVLLTFLLMSVAAAAQSRPARVQGSVDRPDLIFQNYCSVCHGEKGDGKSLARFALDPQPADFTSAEVRKRLSRAHMIETVSKGARTKEGNRTAMISWTTQLNRKHIEAVVDYVIVTFMDGKVVPSEKVQAEGHEHEGHDHSAASVKEVDFPFGLKASASRGKALYSRTCADCHGDKGDDKGSAALQGKTLPRNFRDADFREFATRFTLFSAVSRGHGHMPAWSKAISNQDVADVSEYVLGAFVTSSKKGRRVP